MMKKNIIVNGRKAGEIGDPIDFARYKEPFMFVSGPSKFDKELQKRAAEIRERYGKKGMIPDKNTYS